MKEKHKSVMELCERHIQLMKDSIGLIGAQRDKELDELQGDYGKLEKRLKENQSAQERITGLLGKWYEYGEDKEDNRYDKLVRVLSRLQLETIGLKQEMDIIETSIEIYKNG